MRQQVQRYSPGAEEREDPSASAEMPHRQLRSSRKSSHEEQLDQRCPLSRLTQLKSCFYSLLCPSEAFVCGIDCLGYMPRYCKRMRDMSHS